MTMKDLCEWLGVNRHWLLFNIILAFLAVAVSAAINFEEVPVHALALAPLAQIGSAISDKASCHSYWDARAYAFPRVFVVAFITIGAVFGGFIVGYAVRSCLWG